MKNAGKLSALFLAVGLTAGHGAWAEEAAKPKREFSEKQLAQQQRMRDCSADAKARSLAGDDRKAFMKTCLSAGRVTAEAGTEVASAPEGKKAAQQEKMKACSADAKKQSLKGDDRKAFMKDCLAG